jgi:ABC-type antimicrobial peptide transport system permease subunit
LLRAPEGIFVGVRRLLCGLTSRYITSAATIRTLREQVAGQSAATHCAAHLFFGVLSLVLASIGLYGVTAYSAGLRVGEIGVRMALGADRGHIATLVLRGALPLIVLGLMIGLPLTFAAGNSSAVSSTE